MQSRWKRHMRSTTSRYSACPKAHVALLADRDRRDVLDSNLGFMSNSTTR
jgi:hypothetical protein